jgi:predicted permease
MHALVAAQVAFCFLIHFVAGLFIATFEKLSHRPTGFSSERVLALDTVSERPQPPAAWEQLVARLRETPGVEAAALAGFAPMNGNRWNGRIALNGGPPAEGIVYFLDVSPGWIEAMKIPLLAGRDLRSGDVYPGAVLVNATFAKRYFDGRNPLGGWFERASDDGSRSKFEIAGLVADARYQDLRGPELPVAYVPIPIQKSDGTLAPITNKTVVIRTATADPLALAANLRREVAAVPGLRVSNVQTQLEIVQSHTVRERLLALLASFFAIVAWVLGGVGLYGVLNYSVVQRRREIGIRLAIGASAGDIARRVTATVLTMVMTGAMIGVALGLFSVRSIESLLYEVKVTDFSSLAIPSATIFVAALLAALPAIVHAVRIDPVSILRSE